MIKYRQNNYYQGAGFLQLLALVFIVLKLTKVINWSWWLVTAPLWGGLALVLAILLILLVGFILCKIFGG